MKTEVKTAYKMGYRAAGDGKKKEPPPLLNWEDRHWWLGGYSDWEIENLADSNQQGRQN